MRCIDAEPTAARTLDLRVSPMPARAHSTIHFELPRAGRVDLELFDVAGRRRAVLASGELEAGPHEASLAVSDAGIYFLRLRLGDDILVRRILLFP